MALSLLGLSKGIKVGAWFMDSFGKPFFRHLQKHRMDDENLFEFTINLVKAARNNPELKGGTAKKKWVRQQIRFYLGEVAADVKNSLIDTVIQNSLQAVEAEAEEAEEEEEDGKE